MSLDFAVNYAKETLNELAAAGAGTNLGFACGLAGGGAVADVYAGQMVLYSDQGGEPFVPDDSTRFEIGSVTKVFTASLYVLSLAGSSPKVNADSVLGHFLGDDLPESLQVLKLSDLATYSSGLPADNETNPGTMDPHQKFPYDVESMYSYLKDAEFTLSEAGTYRYSNLGWALLAWSLVKAWGVKGEPSVAISQLYQDQIFSQMTMPNTSFYSAASDAGLPAGQQLVAGKVPAIDKHTWPAYLGAGGMVSTPLDMIQWMTFTLGLMTIPDNSQSSLFLPSGIVTPTGVEVGVGWLLPRIGRQQIATKNGDVPSFSSWVGLNGSPEAGLSKASGVFLLSNSATDVSPIGKKILTKLME